MEVDGIALQSCHIYYNPACLCSVLSAQPRGPHRLSDCAHSPIATSYSQLTLEDTSAQPKAICLFFLGQLDAYRNMDICGKKYHQSCQSAVSALITWGTYHILTTFDKSCSFPAVLPPAV